MMWTWGAGWGWWMLFGWVWMIVFWGLIVWGVFTLVSKLSASRVGDSPSRESALDILERRYASGELTHEQFEDMRRRLTAVGASGSG